MNSVSSNSELRGESDLVLKLELVLLCGFLGEVEGNHML